MKTKNIPLQSLLSFCVFALIGPATNWIVLRNLDWQESSSINSYFYDLVLLLWPVWPIAVIENSTGPFVAVLITVTANIALFGILGTIIGLVANRKSFLLICYVVLCLLVFLLELYGAGFSLAFINFHALLTSFLLYGFPFYYLWKHKCIGQHNDDI